MANKHLSYAQYKEIFGDLGITNWVKYNYLDNFNFPVEDYEQISSVKFNSAYIDTQIVPILDDVYEIVMMDISPSNDGVFGVRSDNPVVTGSFFGIGDGRIGYACFGNADYQRNIPTPLLSDKYHNIRLSNQGLFDTTDRITQSFGATQILTGSNTIYLGAYNMNGNPIYSYSGYIKAFNIYRKGVLILCLTPAKRKSDNAVGFIDRLTNTFFTHSALKEA